MYTEYLTEIEDGIFENPRATSPTSDELEEYYDRRAIKILADDRAHYQNMARVFADLAVFRDEFYNVADIAGGHPKLASFLNLTGEITVYDQYAESYERLHGEFLKYYDCKAPVSYVKKQITHHNFTPNAEVAVCCHILEHLSLKQIRTLLGNLETDKVIIYGPNVERAKNANWLHFRPKDHRTFATIAGMCRLVEEAGFQIVNAVERHEDYLIYGDKK